MPSIENRVAKLEQHRDDRDAHDERVLEVMEKIQKDVHTLAMRVEKKLSFFSGIVAACGFLGGSIGALVVFSLKKIGMA